MSENLLTISNLKAGFEMDGEVVTAVDGVSFEIPHGKTVGLVGESGCGKSVTAFSITRLLPQPSGRILGGNIHFEGRDLASLSEDGLRTLRGKEISMIFQEPMSALNPCQIVGKQLCEVYELHGHKNRAENWAAATAMLAKVGIPSPEIRMGEHPHQLSGGMRQRVMIAMALALKPKLLIADEPTTALDVTVQAQILELIASLQKEMQMSVLLITHDLGVIAETCDEVVVMYAGRVVERAPVHELFANPRHAYTRGLLASIPSPDDVPKTKLRTIEGMVPSLRAMPSGCRFCLRNGAPEDSPTLVKRPEYKQIAPQHWIEACPRCTSLAS